MPLHKVAVPYHGYPRPLFLPPQEVASVVPCLPLQGLGGGGGSGKRRAMLAASGLGGGEGSGKCGAVIVTSELGAGGRGSSKCGGGG